MQALLLANQQILDDAARLIEGLTDACFTRPLPQYLSGSIGQHFRHVFDHYRSLLNEDGDRIDYDTRRRNSPVEHCRSTAVAEIRFILDELGCLTDQDVRIYAEASPTETTVIDARSTLKRELMFTASHAIHHFALIALLLRLQGVSVPPAFGVAPATLSHQRSLRMAI